MINHIQARKGVKSMMKGFMGLTLDIYMKFSATRVAKQQKFTPILLGIICLPFQKDIEEICLQVDIHRR